MAGRSRMSSRPRPAPAPRRSPRSRSRRHRLPRLPTLEQRHLDLLGLGLVALASFLAFVFYLDWDGGRVGSFVASGLLLLFGVVGYVAPLVLLGTGALLILRPMLPSTGPFRTGALCLIAAFSLGLAAALTAVGLLLVTGRGYVERRTGRWLPHASAAALVVLGVVMTLRGAVQV